MSNVIYDLKKGLRKRVVNITPVWFAMTMGTGILSILLFNCPYQFNGLQTISGVVFGINVVLFVVLLLMTIARYAIWPSMLPLMLVNPVNVFLATLTMGFSTIIVCIVDFLVPRYGYNFALLSYVFWYINVAMSIITCIGIPFIQMSRQTLENSQIFATALLPTVSTIVCASTGAAVATVLPENQAIVTITICYILLGMGVPMSLIVLANYTSRLMLFKIPPAAVISSTFIPIGPCGQSAYAILKLARNLTDIANERGLVPFTSVEDPELAKFAASALQTASIPFALIIWGFGCLWLALAIISFFDTMISKRIPINLSLWGCTFPIGTLALSAQELGKEMNVTGMKVVSVILLITLVIIWLILMALTFYNGVIRDKWFSSPCLSDAGGTPPSMHDVEFNRKY
ncbi:hypothetical protein WALSEDRAFT_39915 [Wallemia mellicola CBS 633.66]|uniref:C4-dicarboxylate transporter/malic acid transport protein n=1 Tax=Wallemia mellicola (strain ATCC MYA-4683 / CBS 633.66) TaxID=671144 RepID=I4Y946_WALMC|nr:hypothetical protein WALSEDRAFT_39915 [Wallemia mellicola CBS 633.66]TIB79861.1 hypothetical protein E3Q21_03994 [Wallemia mellicola]EIM20488.1 hypothetical protein WALSEDRAFT_39915 [Wallemia mellicola CBS 633.66]TIB83861.1 hypothetical protein E3Q20_03947 [Wallemia mellicola]TIC19949.1 hypothetical protein E3Q12_04041 [Wallemia mellicola]TIC38218.1 hypothetical protein E3Q07_04004 [Wallemia mellicola]|eukprot:XP_006959514.1 hypothetical protein WALSEDRAFT_39915 [Wallemia mellicola CBS 633.66]